LLEVEGLQIWRGDHRLVGPLHLRIEPGALTGLVGPSGAGKSLTLRSLLGLLPVGLTARGTLRFTRANRAVSCDLADASAPRTLAELRGRDITLLAQAASPSLDPVRTVGAQLEELIRLHGTSAEVGPLLDRQGLGIDFADRLPRSLSGGEAQRVALSMALACDPVVLLADEPTASLDPPAASWVHDQLGALRDDGRTLIVVTHDLGALRGLADTIFVLAEGQVVDRGSTEDVMRDATSPTTRAMVAAAQRGSS
jgi:ABC-type glutathione transport system ATPase component